MDISLEIQVYRYSDWEGDKDNINIITGWLIIIGEIPILGDPDRKRL